MGVAPGQAGLLRGAAARFAPRRTASSLLAFFFLSSSFLLFLPGRLLAEFRRESLGEYFRFDLA